MKKNYAIWTDEEVSVLRKVGAGKPSQELVELLPRHTALGIRLKRERLGIKLTQQCLSHIGSQSRSCLDNDKLCKTDQKVRLDDLDDATVQVLLGSMLGDGCVKMPGRKNTQRNFIFFEGHCNKQRDYVFWKMKYLSMFLPKKSRANTHSEFFTVSHHVFTMLRDKFYSSRCYSHKTKLPIDLLSKIDLFGFMIWYLDDGTLGKNGKSFYPSIAAMGYNRNELIALADMLNNKFGLSLKVSKNKLLRIPAKNREYLFPHWKSLAKEHALPECVHYKLDVESL